MWLMSTMVNEQRMQISIFGWLALGIGLGGIAMTLWDFINSGNGWQIKELVYIMESNIGRMIIFSGFVVFGIYLKTFSSKLPW